MKIAKNHVVSIDYTLTDDQGKVLDSSEGHAPLVYIQGIGNIIPGLEKALEGKGIGDHLKVRIKPEEAYGVRDDNLVQKVPAQHFESPESLELGMQFEVETSEGFLVVTVVKIDKEEVTVDGNHPLAGVPLNFDVRVKEIRDATAEEIQHGHAHGPGGHHH